MPETGLADLYILMRDQRVGMRQRINAAISASRVEVLSMPGEAPPEAIVFLRHVIGFEGHGGERFSPQFRRESAAAVSFWERRCKKAELTYAVADVDERRRTWCRVINGCIRYHLGKHGHWPGRKDVLLRPADTFEMPAIDPERALSALLLPAGNRKARRRQKAIDERVSDVWSGTEEERREILRPIAEVVHQRLARFGLA